MYSDSTLCHMLQKLDSFLERDLKFGFEFEYCLCVKLLCPFSIYPIQLPFSASWCLFFWLIAAFLLAINGIVPWFKISLFYHNLKLVKLRSGDVYVAFSEMVSFLIVPTFLSNYQSIFKQQMDDAVEMIVFTLY